jgi:hypothetical protein
VLPNLIVIGAAKCGTTSLHAYLGAHPEISMSSQKELDFFVPEKSGGRSADWYANQFPDAPVPVRGECSPSYTAYPVYRGVPERIRELIPDVRLVYLVRDPVERIVSHYIHRISTHPELQASLEQMLDDPSQGEWLLTLSRYWLQLERYLAHFPPERILVVDSDDLRERREVSLRQIFTFVGVDPEYTSNVFATTHNPRPQPTRRTFAGRMIHSGLSRVVGPGRAAEMVVRSPPALRDPFRRLVERPAPSDSLRDRLAEELRADVHQLRRHTGLAFAGWSL